MKELFVEFTSEELDESLSMSHSPSGENEAVCAPCQGACFCKKSVDQFEVVIEELL